MNVSVYHAADALPARMQALWASPDTNVITGRDWLHAYVEEARSPGERLRLFGVEDEVAGSPRPLALMTGFTSRVYGALWRARVLRFHQPDGAGYIPVTAPQVSVEQTFAAVLAHACSMRPVNDVVRIAPLPRPSARFDTAAATLRAGGFILQRYPIFDNRFERTAGVSAAQYLASRPSRLRNTIVRRDRAFERAANGRFVLVTREEGIDAVFDDYDSVFSKSWKLGEHMVSMDYIRELMRAAARVDRLRLGLLYVDDEAVAAQAWFICGGTAMCYRLAYTQKLGKLSPGTVLTWRMVRHLLDEDRVSELDFGIGDDDYKAEWMGELREYWGIDAFNPRTARGLRCAVRHLLPPMIKPVLRPLWRRVRPWLGRE